MDRTLIATVADRPGVLTRVASLFRRRAYNIESLTVGHTERPGISRMTIVVDSLRTDARKVAQNLEKLVDVQDVQDVTDRRLILRDLALIKVKLRSPETRSEVLRIAERLQGCLVDMCPHTAVIEITGSEEEIDTAVEALRGHGILEMVRTGQVAMVRGDPDPKGDGRPASEAPQANGSEGGITWQG
jgi:acetolactate synthase-1/3 small subunit